MPRLRPCVLQGLLEGATFAPYTTSTLPGMGIFRTHLCLPAGYDTAALDGFDVRAYLAASAAQCTPQLQVRCWRGCCRAACGPHPVLRPTCFCVR